MAVFSAFGVWTSSRLNGRKKLEPFNGQPQNFYHEGIYVVVQPLHGRGLGNFSAVVAADRNTFVDSGLSPLLLASQVVAVLPYPVFIITIILLQIYRDRGRRQNLRRVHVLHEGMATLEHTSNSGPNDLLADNEFHSNLDNMRDKQKQRNQERLIAVQREALYSMSNFLQNTVMSKPKGDKDTEGRLVLQMKSKE